MKKKCPQTLIHNLHEWRVLVENTNSLAHTVIQDVNFCQEKVDWTRFHLNQTSFLGCTFKRRDAIYLIEKGAFVYPKFKNIPYNPYRNFLYTWQELMEGYHPNQDKSRDLKIYKHFSATKYNPSVHEAMAQRIHDHSIDDALRKLLGYDDYGMTQRKCVGFMGGHATKRGSEFYNKTALVAKRIAQMGYYVVTGGGPGIMEAANLGAYMAHYPEEDLHDAIAILQDLKFTEPNQVDYLAENYAEQSKIVLERYPNACESLAIPTWFYGHEPSNVFATHIAKYFSNSIREDTLLAISLFGIVYAPGSAGTTQEIFQEAAQNHYGTFGYYSPMIFLGVKRYVEDTTLYSVLHQLAKGKTYKKLLYLTDDADEVVEFIINNPPIKVE